MTGIAPASLQAERKRWVIDVPAADRLIRAWNRALDRRRNDRSSDPSSDPSSERSRTHQRGPRRSLGEGSIKPNGTTARDSSPMHSMMHWIVRSDDDPMHGFHARIGRLACGTHMTYRFHSACSTLLPDPLAIFPHAIEPSSESSTDHRVPPPLALARLIHQYTLSYTLGLVLGELGHLASGHALSTTDQSRSAGSPGPVDHVRDDVSRAHRGR